MATDEPDERVVHVRFCGGAAGNRCLYPAADPRLRRSVVSWGLWKVRFGWLRFLGSPGAGG